MPLCVRLSADYWSCRLSCWTRSPAAFTSLTLLMLAQAKPSQRAIQHDWMHAYMFICHTKRDVKLWLKVELCECCISHGVGRNVEAVMGVIVSVLCEDRRGGRWGEAGGSNCVRSAMVFQGRWLCLWCLERRWARGRKTSLLSMNVSGEMQDACVFVCVYMWGCIIAYYSHYFCTAVFRMCTMWSMLQSTKYTT